MKAFLPYLKRLAAFSPILLTIAFFGLAAEAQTNAVDLSFNAVPDKNSASPANFLLQPDGKILVFGGFQVVNGSPKNQMARLNPDGTLDNTFNCAVCDFSIGSAVLQPDGKIVVAGSSSGNAVVRRMNPDGSRDANFTLPFSTTGSQLIQSASVRAIQPDGKILLLIASSFLAFSDYSFVRLNPNGTFDSSFSSPAFGGGHSIVQTPGKVLVLSDGKILVAINTYNGAGSSASLRRFNANGTPDTTFEAPSFNPSGFPFTGSLISDMELLGDGGLIIVGRFAGINAVSRQNVAKLLPAGNVDLSFNNSDIGEASGVEVLPNGKILISSGNRFNRLNADGSFDMTFNSPPSLTQIYNWAVDASGNVVVNGLFNETGAQVNKFARLNADGSIANSFTVSFGVAASITTLTAQTDGKIIFAGDFVRVNGVPRVSIVRVNADGSLDATFVAGSGFDYPVEKIVVQPDGKILVGGQFNNYNGIARSGIVRLNADGSLDANFNAILPASSSVYTIALQADGKILIGGFFGSVNGQTRSGVARLNADGSLDTSFNPIFGNSVIRSIVVEASGKIMVGGTFNGVNGFSRVDLVRLNADGSLDASFNAGNIAGVNQIEVLTDGKYLVANTTIVRLNANGTIDTTFLSPIFQAPNVNNVFLRFLAQPDGSILVGGNFTLVNNAPRPYLTRLRPNGALETGFFPNGANAPVRAIARQADGRILVGGDFSSIGGVPRLGIARLNVAPYRLITPYDYDGDGRADVAVFRPSNGNWYILPSQTNAFYGFPFGQTGDQIAPADYDGDGRTDIAVFRPGAFAYFYIFDSSTNAFRFAQFGTTGDVPMSGDWDGDGRADLAVYRAASAAGGQSNFYYRPSSQPGVDYNTIPLGTLGDKPLYGDFDGDGRLDPAVFRPSTATWIILRSSINQITQTQFGLSTDIPVPADYDGDGAASIAVFRPSNGTWYTSQNPATNYGAIQFGASGDIPVPADYDGDGRADTAVFRLSNGAWYLNRTTSGFTGVQFGISGDKPAPSAFVH